MGKKCQGGSAIRRWILQSYTRDEKGWGADEGGARERGCGLKEEEISRRWGGGEWITRSRDEAKERGVHELVFWTQSQVCESLI